MGLLKRIFDKKKETQKEPTKNTIGTPKEQIKARPVEIKKTEPKPVPKVESQPKKVLTDLDKIIMKEDILYNKIWDKNYYGSEESKVDFRGLQEEKREYMENNPTDFRIRGASLYGMLWGAIDRLPLEEKILLKTLGEGYYYEQDLEQYEKAIEIYNKGYELTWEYIGDELIEMIKEYGEREYLYTATFSNRIKVCEDSIHWREIKKLEAEAKELEETDPKEAIKRYEELNQINPGLQKYNKRIYRILELEANELEKTNPKEAIRRYEELNKLNPGLKKYNKRIYKLMELEARELEETDPLEAIKIYGELNVLNPGLKKYDKRIEIIKRKLE